MTPFCANLGFNKTVIRWISVILTSVEWSCLKMRISDLGTLLILCAALVTGGPNVASASMLHPEVVSEDPANYTPSTVATTAVPLPHVDAIAQLGNTVFAGGLFDSVTHSFSATPYPRNNFMAFDALNGAVRTGIAPNFDDQIWAIESIAGAVYVGGEFTTVDGISRSRLVKLNAVTGAVDVAFNASFSGGGVVRDLQMWNGPNGTTPMLIVAGSIPGKLVALNPDTGANLGYFNLGITDRIPGAWGASSVYNFAINPAGTKLVAVGNFRTVSGQARKHLFVANLTGPSALLDPWYYPGFAKNCWSVNVRRVAYLQAVDFSPDGTYFVLAATGFVPLVSPDDIWPDGASTYHTVCDAVARFDLSDDTKPHWINYTGGDSFFAVAATGAAVYAQGHTRWLDNPFGRDSAGPGALIRRGIGAIDPETGKALSWDPRKPAARGGTAFLVTEDGLWVGSDSVRFSGELHGGIAFVPLP